MNALQNRFPMATLFTSHRALCVTCRKSTWSLSTNLNELPSVAYQLWPRSLLPMFQKFHYLSGQYAKSRENFWIILNKPIIEADIDRDLMNLMVLQYFLFKHRTSCNSILGNSKNKQGWRRLFFKTDNKRYSRAIIQRCRIAKDMQIMKLHILSATFCSSAIA